MQELVAIAIKGLLGCGLSVCDILSSWLLPS